MRTLVASLACILLCALVGCSGASRSPGAGPQDPPPFPGSVAATTWRIAEDPPDGFGPGAAGFATPRALLNALMEEGVRAEGGLEEGMRLVGGILDEGSTAASAWIQVIGTMDDSGAGSEIRLLLGRAAAGWFVERISWRDHCRRGVDAASDICI